MKNLNWRKAKFYAFLVLLLGFGVLLLLYGSQFMGHAAEGIGEALIIAGILALTVDGYVKGHLLKEATHDILEYVIGYRLPHELQGALKGLTSTNFISRNMHLHYDLSLTNDTPATVLGEVTVSYDAENISNKILTYVQFCYQHTDLSPTFLELRCDSDDESARYHRDANQLTEQLIGQEGKFNAEVSGPKIQLQPCTHPSKYQFTTKFTLLFPEDSSDFYTFENPTMGVIITAKYPAEIDFSGPSAPINVDRWECPDVFLAGSGITVQWRKKIKV